jgi:hypothetical protein
MDPMLPLSTTATGSAHEYYETYRSFGDGNNRVAA